MELKISVTWQTIIISLLFVGTGFFGGYFFSHQYDPQINEYNLSERDMNAITKLSYLSGECERQGLVTSVYVQQDINGNMYGIPICITPQVNNK